MLAINEQTDLEVNTTSQTIKQQNNITSKCDVRSNKSDTNFIKLPISKLSNDSIRPIVANLGVGTKHVDSSLPSISSEQSPSKYYLVLIDEDTPTPPSVSPLTSLSSSSNPSSGIRKINSISNTSSTSPSLSSSWLSSCWLTPITDSKTETQDEFRTCKDNIANSNGAIESSVDCKFTDYNDIYDTELIKLNSKAEISGNCVLNESKQDSEMVNIRRPSTPTNQQAKALPTPPCPRRVACVPRFPYSKWSPSITVSRSAARMRRLFTPTITNNIFDTMPNSIGRAATPLSDISNSSSVNGTIRNLASPVSKFNTPSSSSTGQSDSDVLAVAVSRIVSDSRKKRNDLIFQKRNIQLNNYTYDSAINSTITDTLINTLTNTSFEAMRVLLKSDLTKFDSRKLDWLEQKVVMLYKRFRDERVRRQLVQQSIGQLIGHAI